MQYSVVFINNDNYLPFCNYNIFNIYILNALFLLFIYEGLIAVVNNG